MSMQICVIGRSNSMNYEGLVCRFFFLQDRLKLETVICTSILPEHEKLLQVST